MSSHRLSFQLSQDFGLAIIMCIACLGCAANQEPFQQQLAAQAQQLPQNTKQERPLWIIWNGHASAQNGAKAIVDSAELGNGEQIERTLFGPDNEYAEANSQVNAPAATFSQALSWILVNWGDSSQAGDQAASAKQDANLDQRIKAAVEAAFSAQGIGQMQTTQSGAVEGDAAAQGGSMDQQLDLFLQWLRANPDALEQLRGLLAIPTPNASTQAGDG